MTVVRLGYEVGTGAAVEIPLKHLAICGQTQEAGKTTALEGLITRSGLKALTFVTKRGEGSFTQAVRHPPYFREQADWQFVASILEASRGERMKFERAWIIRASRGATSLADVQENVRRAMKKATGLSADVYLTLDAYLDQVVPTIGLIAWADAILLRPGVNVMDLTMIPAEMQHLVIKSSLDWVLHTATDTVVVIPEAWKFIPQGRGTPVKLAAEALIRQGAGLRNYVWLDSQDLGGIEKVILRSVAVWLLGVQREANEIKRTLENIPGGVAKPSKTTMATLQLGEFYACWGRHAIKTYAQPAWLAADDALSIAMGLRSVEDVRPTHQEEATVNEQQAAQLTEDNARLRKENAELRERLERVERQHAFDAQVTQIRQAPAGEGLRTTSGGGGNGAAPGPGWSSGDLPTDHDTEGLYQRFKARLLAEAPSNPILLKVLVTRPALVVEIEPVVMPVDGSTVKGRVARLIAQGWFAGERPVGEVRRELARTGSDPGGGGALGILLSNLVKDGLLTREGAGFQRAPGVTVTERELRV